MKQKITDRIGVKVAPTDPDYWGLASVMTEEEAALTAHMKVRKPLTFEQLQSASGFESEKLQQLLDDLSIKASSNITGRTSMARTRIMKSAICFLCSCLDRRSSP